MEIGCISRRGFVTSTDVSTMPVISKFLVKFTESEDFIKGDKSIETYKWIFNIIMLHLYEVTQILLNEVEKDSDLWADLIILSRIIHDLMEPSIRLALAKRGISVIQNIFAGLDTEYHNLDEMTNKLLSIQVAGRTVTYIRLPLLEEWDFRTIHTLTGKGYKMKDLDFSIFSYDKVRSNINSLISRIRPIKYGGLDSALEEILNSFKQLRNVTSFTREGFEYIRLNPTQIIQWINLCKEERDYKLEEVIESIEDVFSQDLATSFQLVKDIINQNDGVNIEVDLEKLTGESPIRTLTNEVVEGLHGSQTIAPNLTRTKITGSHGAFSLTRRKNTNLICHFSSADLSMFKDFEGIKKDLDILAGSFVTMGKSVQVGKHAVIIRDTMLLAPGGCKSLAQIGNTYKLPKMELTGYEISNMDKLKELNPDKFIQYALNDSLITLTHAVWMEAWSFSHIKSLGIPITLASVGKKFLLTDWENSNYDGYQMNPEFTIGDASDVQTPFGLHEFGKIGHMLSYFIANYKGGNNQSLMYGIDQKTKWYDYDLTSAYTSVMYAAGHPDYSRAKRITLKDLNAMSNHDLIYSYTIIDCKFRFPADTKYPSILEYINDSAVVFPLEGKAILTGSQYLVAKNQGCVFSDVENIFTIPFKPEENLVEGKSVPLRPFANVLKEVQTQRRKHKKGTMSNLLYKEMGNGLYGSVVRGMANKRKYNNKTG